MKKSCFFRIQIFILQIFLYFCRIWSFVTRSRIEDPKSSQRPLKRRGRPQTHYFGTIHRRRKDEGLIVGRRGDWELSWYRGGWVEENRTPQRPHCGIICRFILYARHKITFGGGYLMRHSPSPYMTFVPIRRRTREVHTTSYCWNAWTRSLADTHSAGPGDATNTFTNSGIDVLVLDNFLVEKK